MKLHKPTMRSFRRDEEAVRKLSPEQFRVTQRSGTERLAQRPCAPPSNNTKVSSDTIVQ
jgi:peptide methionine sulfoxide reductase MsrB